MARSMSQAQLKRLYDESRVIASQKPAWKRAVFEESRTMPNAWRDLKPISVTIDPSGHRARFHLACCAGDKTTLLISGIGDATRARIALTAGEWQPEETLWRASP